MKIYDIIKYEGPNDVLVWKHDCEDFTTMSQLIVHETQEAILFKNGQALDLFPPGRYTLQTQNLPLLRRIAALPSDGKTPFHCEVYFISKTLSMNIGWGTSAPVMVQDPIFRIDVHVKANGQMAIAVQDGRKLLVKLVGTEMVFDQSTLKKYFKAILNMHIKSAIAEAMMTGGLSANMLAGSLLVLSKEVGRRLENEFEQYGLGLRHFNFDDISIDLDDPGYQKIQQAISEQMSRATQGFTWQEQQAYEVAKAAAANEGVAGSITGAGLGIGMGLPVGNAVGGMVVRAMEPILPTQSSQPPIPTAMPQGIQLGPVEKVDRVQGLPCPECNSPTVPGGAFCHNCGAPLDHDKKCKRCQQPLPTGALYCPACGAKDE